MARVKFADLAVVVDAQIATTRTRLTAVQERSLTGRFPEWQNVLDLVLESKLGFDQR